jgi:CRP-like cAMP-binding protein
MGNCQPCCADPDKQPADENKAGDNAGDNAGASTEQVGLEMTSAGASAETGTGTGTGPSTGAGSTSASSIKPQKKSSKIALQSSSSQLTSSSRNDVHNTTSPHLDDAAFEDIHTLVTIPFFDELDHKNAKVLSQMFDRSTYSDGEIIAEEKKSCKQFSIILSGSVKITALSSSTPDGDGDNDNNHSNEDAHEEVELSRLHKGMWFGETASVTDSRTQPVTIRAIADTTILSISVDTFQKAVSEYPALSVSLCSLGSMPPLNIQLKSIPFFADLPEYKLQQLGYLIDVVKVKKKEVICRQGDTADGFYYIAEGRVIVTVLSDDQKEEVHLDTLSKGHWFGEIALMQDTKRTATITTTQDCVLLFLQRERFERFLHLCPEIRESGMFQRLITKRTANSLKAIPLFSMFKNKQVGPMTKFDENKLSLLGQLFRFRQYQAGDTVFGEGDAASTFCIIVRGTCNLTATSPDSKGVDFGTLSSNDWFGEQALFQQNNKRTSTVKAISDVLLLELEQKNFESFSQIAPELETILRARAAARTSEQLKAIPFFAGVKENKPWSKLDLLGGLFAFEEYDAGAVVVQEGSIGDKFFIIVEGSIKVSVKRNNEDIDIDELSDGQWFGEIALMMDTPRTATVRCETHSLLLSITSARFKKFLDVAPELTSDFDALVRHRLSNTLSGIELFKRVKENKPWSKLEMVGTLFRYERVEAKEVMYTFGDIAEKWYLLIRGTCQQYGRAPNSNDDNANDELIDMGELKEQDHFGEVELLYNRPRHTRVVSNSECIFMVLNRASFLRLLKVAPELKPYFQEHLEARKKYVSSGSISVMLNPNDESFEALQSAISAPHAPRLEKLREASSLSSMNRQGSLSSTYIQHVDPPADPNVPDIVASQDDD